MHSEPANRYYLSEEVRNHILKEIATGEVSSGYRIAEARISNELKISSIPVQESIRELVAIEVLEYIVYQWAQARETSMSETVEALHLKVLLEAPAVLLADKKPERRIPELLIYLKLFLESALRNCYIDYQKQNQLLHRAFVDTHAIAKEHENIIRAAESEYTEGVASLLISRANRPAEHPDNQMAFNKEDVG